MVMGKAADMGSKNTYDINLLSPLNERGEMGLSSIV